MLQQIDTLSAIALTFSDFAKMPETNKVLLNATEVVQWAVQLFSDDRVSLKAEAETINLKIDRNHLVQLVNNLVKNALEAVEGVENAVVEVRLFQDKKAVVLEVEDNGKGMSEEVLSRMFEPRFTTKNSGMGLGLAVVKTLVEENGGTIECHSTLNEGSLFKLRFSS